MEECLDVLMLLAQTEGILLDPVSSGKMMAGFLAQQAAGRWSTNHRILLLHSGGVPTLFAYAKELHEQLRKFRVDVLSQRGEDALSYILEDTSLRTEKGRNR